MGIAVVALSVYEAAAEAVNETFDEHLLPSILGGLERFKLRRVVDRLSESWLLIGALVGAAAVVEVVNNPDRFSRRTVATRH